MGFENVGLVWTPQSLKDYLGTIAKPGWCDAITLHHTASPSLAQRPNGLILQHLKNLRDFYRDEKGWSAGPHLFVDEDQAWGMCDFRKKGVHAVSFNKRAIGIEVLGDYDSENPKSGRGLLCWETAAATTKVLLEWLGLPADKNTVLFHRDDPETSKSCPGTKVKKDWILGLIGGATAAPVDTKHPKPETDVTLKSSEMKFAGEQWCAPVLTYMKKKGVSAETVASKLKKVGPNSFYGDEWLEGAFYDGASEMTWAPVRELEDLA
jgi:hypothetical protein